MERRQEVRTFETDYICDTCKIGSMRPTGNVLTTYPPIFPHQCNNNMCKEMASFNVAYPFIEHEPVR